ncbi:tRNA lysidine(34) synthetase TilS [Chloroflexota bacterium]
MRKQGYQELLEQRVLKFIQEHNLVSGRHRVLVAVSGGPDSVCLLHILTKLQQGLNIELHIAHLDHQLRGEESAADARYVSQLARQLDIPATIEARDVNDYKARYHTSLEEAAREVRYAFLAEVSGSIGADCVATGHTAGDHIETVLLHLIRGTGTRGLRGLQQVSHLSSPEWSLTLIRPLLIVNRQETERYCDVCRLEPRFDASNLSMSPLRNRVRHQLLPLLGEYNSQIDSALLRTARIAADDLACLDEISTGLASAIVQKQGENIALDRDKFLGLPAALKRHLLRRVIEELLGSLKDIEARHIEEIIVASGKPAGTSINLPGGLVFVVEYDRYLLAPAAALLCPLPNISGEYELKIPGETVLPGWRVVATTIGREQMEAREDGYTAYFNLDSAGDKVVVRSRRRGDRFQPLGMSQSKKLGEYMIDAKVPRAWRQRVLILCSPEHILWVVGYRIDDRAKVTEDTKQVLRLEFERV